MTKKAIIYARFSPCPGSDENLSSEKQIERCRDYCSRNDYIVSRIEQDDAVSGTQLERPSLNLAIENLSDSMVLVVDRSDRLARDVIVDLTIRQRVKATGATIEFADGSPNEDTPEGRLISGVFALFAAFERDRIASRTSAGLKRKQAEGIHLGRPPVGFRVDPGTKMLVKHEREQAAIDSILTLGAQGYTSEAIADVATNRHGFFRGNPWSPRTVRKIINGK
jgi:DNA invertase Pin-like site-specific DNA recombinase